MKKYKNGIIGVVATFLIATLFFFDLNDVKALDACEKGKASDIEARYDLILEKENNNQFCVKMNGEKKDLGDAKFKITGTVPFDEDGTPGTIIGNIDRIPLITKDNKACFNADPEILEGEGLALKINVAIVEGLEGCEYTGTLGIKWDDNSAIESNIFGDGKNSKDNTNSIHVPGSICYNFYNGIWNEDQFTGINKSDFDEYNYQAAKTLTIQGQPAQATYKDILAYCWADKVSTAAEYKVKDIANMIGNLIAYVKIQIPKTGSTDSTFDQYFDDIRNKALQAGNNMSGKDPKVNNLKCNWKLKAAGKDGDDYYVNKNYFYKKEVTDKVKVTYTYNYAPGNTKEQQIDACDRVCEEAVKVEYGPPVASKAGLCFQYKVKVTSYVKCSTGLNLSPPSPNQTYCSPEPYCHEKNYKWDGYNAGPNGEFDLCIDECDGGKYTSKCSQKCYKEVYGKTYLPLTADYEAYIENLSQDSTYDIDACIEQSNDGGCYYWSGDTIHWKSKHQKGQAFVHDVAALGRWYRERGGSYSSLYVGIKVFDSSSDGIKTRIKNTPSGHCDDICAWNDNGHCTKSMYLNPQAILEDYQNNLKAYQDAVTRCQAAATCTSSTAEYTISLNYDTKQQDGSIKVNRQDFPISTKDQISSKGKGSANINTATSKNTTIIDYKGCYKDENANDWYLTEWSFPGTYIHNKTGEISFQVPNNSSSWHYEDKKYCMPLNAESVNKKWWEWAKLNSNCYTDKEIEKELQGTPGTSNGYNIEALVKHFGYFDWQFDIKCFYAMRNELCNINKDGCCEPNPPTCTDPSCIKKATGNYTIRSVDLGNLFPNAKVEGVVDSTKRDIGFNWTQQARISSTKNRAYEVDPSRLIEDIQNNANTIYSDASNLDYQFYLTPSALQDIRRYNKKYDYGVWNGTTMEKNGVMVYSSNLFRNTGIESNILSSSGEVVKKLGEIGINNEN